MASFYYNSGLGKGIITQWIEHLQTESYINDFDKIITKNRKEIETTLINSSAKQTEVITNICGQLEEVNYHLESINSNITGLRSEINNMASMLNWNLSQMIEEQRLSNQLLNKISQLLRIPDSQRQRVYHIEQGLKYLKNAILENDVDSSFFLKAMNDFKKAESIEKNDFITLNKIGQIHLYSNKYMDFLLAEKYFIDSAKESYAEFNVGGTTTSNNLNPTDSFTNTNSKIFQLCKNNQVLDAVKLYSSQYGVSLKIAKYHIDTVVKPSLKLGKPLNDYLVATAESYLYAGRACYLQQNLDKAIEYTTKAFDLIPNFLEAGFELAKYLSANNKETQSEKILKSVIQSDRYFSIKTFNDRDLFNKENIQYLLNELRDNAILSASERINQIKKEISKNSKAKQILEEINIHFKKGSFLSVMKSIDILNDKHSFENKTYSQVDSRTIKISKQITTNTIYDFIQKENYYLEILNELKEKTKKDIVFDNAKSGIVYGGTIGFFIFNFISKMFFETTIVSMLIITIITAIIGAYIGYSLKPKIIYVQ